MKTCAAHVVRCATCSRDFGATVGQRLRTDNVDGTCQNKFRPRCQPRNFWNQCAADNVGSTCQDRFSPRCQLRNFWQTVAQQLFANICASNNVAWTFWANVVSCATSQCTCEGILRRRGSMHMWCLHGVGREIWERVLPCT